MKKLTALVLVIVMVLAMMTSCSIVDEIRNRLDGHGSSETEDAGKTGEDPSSTSATHESTPTAATLASKLKENMESGFTATLTVKDESGEVLPFAVKMITMCDAASKRVNVLGNVTDTNNETLIDVMAYCSENEFACKLAPLVSETYGINFDTAAEDFGYSVFVPYARTQYSLDSETYSKIMELLMQKAAGDNSADSKLTELAEKLDKIVENYADFTKTELKEMFKVRKNALTGTTTVGGEINGTVIMNFLTKLADKLDSDKEIRTVIKDAAMQFSGGQFDEAELDEMLDGFSFREYLPTIDDFGDTSLDVTGEFGKKNGNLTIRENGGKDAVTLAYTADDSHFNAVLTVEQNGQASELFSLESEADGSKLNVRAKLTADGNTVAAELAAADGRYTAKVSVTGDDAATIELSGAYEITETRAVFTADEIMADTGDKEVRLKSLKAELVIEAGAPKISVPQYTNFLRISEEELARLIDKISSAFAQDDPYPVDPTDTTPFEHDPKLLAENQKRMNELEAQYTPYIAYNPYESMTLRGEEEDVYFTFGYYSDYGFLTEVEAYRLLGDVYERIQLEWFDYDESGLLTYYTYLEPDGEDGYIGVASAVYENGTWVLVVDPEYDEPGPINVTPELIAANKERLAKIAPDYADYFTSDPYSCRTVAGKNGVYLDLSYDIECGFLTAVETYKNVDGVRTGIQLEWFDYDETGLLTYYSLLEPNEYGYIGAKSGIFENGAWALYEE